NRLEQVLARAEWRDPDIHEGLLLDRDGHVVSATAANLFVLHAGRWLTPDLGECGVAGVCRAWAAASLGAGVARILPADVERADAVFVCNAVRGILPVTRLGDRNWSPHPDVTALQRRLSGEHPAFAASAPASEFP
ncbi:MAG TPA: aminotransferase class IV, partial [Lysobacter sp.]